MKSIICLLVLLGVCYVLAAPAVEPWAGAPAACSPYISTGQLVFLANGAGTQPLVAAAIDPLITALNATGPSCRTMSISSTCKYAFPIFNGAAPELACKSNCIFTLSYCLQTFILLNSGVVPPPFDNCNGGFWEQTAAPCNPPISNAPFLDPSWEVEPFSLTTTFSGNATLQAKYSKVYSYCGPHLPADIFVSDQAPQRVLAAIVLPKLLALEAAKNVSLPYACFNATVELICKTAYPLGVTIPPNSVAPGFPPIEFDLPRPPCLDVCTVQNSQCAEAFYIGNALDQLVNCSAPSSFPGFPQYPKHGWTLPFGALPCVAVSDAHPRPTFSCESYNPQVSGNTCAKYITYPIWIPPASAASIAALGTTPTQTVLAAAAAPLLKASKALPDYCRQNQEELICKTVFAACSITKFNISTRNPPVAFDFTYGGAPCKTVCTAQNAQCAQILSITGNDARIPLCDSISSTGLPSYPSVGYDFQNGILVPCSPSTVPHQPKPFACEDWDGKPEVCKPYVDYKVMTTPDFDQKYLAKQIVKALEGTDALPDSCKESLYEMACRTGFRKCQKEKAGGVQFNFGRRPCKSQCEQVVQQCGGLFLLAGKSDSIPNCNEVDTTDGQNTYPRNSLKYSAFGEDFKLPCVEPDVNVPSKPPVRCEKLQKDARFCKDYVGNSIFASDPLPQDTAIAVVSQFNELLKEAPDSCKKYALNLACNVMFQKCEEVKEDGFMGILVSPPCKSLCTDMPKSCKKYFDFYGIPTPDCNEKDPITGQPRYTSSWKFKLGKKTYTNDCTRGILENEK